MYAVISDKNRQTTVKKGDVIVCDLHDDLEPGSEISFDDVLLVGNEGDVKIGTPTVSGASVKGEVLGMIKGPKVVSLRYHRRNNVRVKRGHRQRYTQVRITEING